MSTQSHDSLRVGVKPAEIDGALSKEIPVEDEVVSLPPAPFKDGGLRAWLQVFGCFLVFFNVWGFTFAFGLFQNYYETHLLSSSTASEISWIGTLASYLLIVIGIISGPLFDLGHYRIMLFGGAAMSCFGIFMLSLSKEYYQIILTQGICTGLGCGVLFIPGMALVSRSFNARRAVALGLISCGAPFGGIIYTIVFEQLIDSLGFAWTVRVMGFIMTGTFLAAFPLLLWGASNTGDISSGTTRKLFDKAALKDIGFWFYTSANFFIFTGYLVPFFYIPSYAQLSLGTSRALALYSVVIAQGSSVIGRMIFATLALHIGVMIPWVMCASVSAILCLGWIGIKTTAAFCGFCALYGFFSGALIPLPPSIFPVVCPDPKVLGTRLGMAQAIGATASLIGSPIAGALVGDKGQHYIGLQLFSGLVMLIGTAFQIFLWINLVKKRNCKVSV
ncbi:hypothetical protein G647_01661 [Cladophialophora carrionii CBS 160.54]|uniref:Major facilitator superfamily (MFS) profile domain-containing protein n=1 Tax=Cladophialophora carrionii CBS 160.54 TaxID=1279043 RepID=V9DSA6_9EURO|nr:uncharacterized protein G647_01661 [Cladophialophora carrionii CBS 160.54]ETI29208.1 hypothetical protein G647_01661 [Cladophialophora carrionii CBS 160.54]